MHTVYSSNAKVSGMKSKIDYNQELNEAQREAVFSTEGPHLVIAGAGSGKTRVLVFRTAYLVEQGTLPENILLLTFTRRAAREMLARASLLLDDRCQKVAGGTFHSFANMILRRHGELLGIPRSFSILDEDDAESAVQSIVQHLGFHKIDRRFPKKKTILDIISKSVNTCQDVGTIIYDEFPHFSEWSDVLGRIQEEYARYKKTMSVLDYDDLLIYLDDLLASQKDLCQQLSGDYHYLMVDEYQDTNKIQARIIQRLCSVHRNVMAVGDDSQSIYSFRGANFRNIIDFPKIFPGTKVVMLEENYRSSQPILDLTNEVMNSANSRYEKVLFTNNKGKERPVYVDTTDEHSQSRYIVERIVDLHHRQGVELKDIAVLFRSGWHSNDLEIELAASGIPFVKYGGQKFVEAAHIKDALSYLRVAFNPYNEISWTRILTLMKGIGPKSAQQIIDEIVRQGKGLDIDDKWLQKSRDLQKLLGLFKATNCTTQSPFEVLKRFLEFYYPYLMDQYDDYDKRLNDLQSLENIASRYHSFEDFLTDMALEPPEKNLADQRGRDEQALTLSTIHSAKGLEWHTVFIVFLADGYLPSYRSLENVDAIEEERRLFYVATTRARKHLFLLRPQMDRSARMGMDSGGSIFTRLSRFLTEGRILQDFVKVERDYSQAAW